MQVLNENYLSLKLAQIQKNMASKNQTYDHLVNKTFIPYQIIISSINLNC
jgi:hypothetical protein